MEKVVVFLCSVIIVCFTLSIITHNNEVQSLKEQIFSLEKENLLLKEENRLLKQENDKNAFEKKYSEVLKYTKEIDRIKEEIEFIPEDYREKVLALCWTESHLKYNVSHPWNDSTTGVCGIKSSFWKDFVTKSGVEVNSLYAGYLVLKYLEDKANGDFFQAVKKYKGANKNLYPVYKAVNLYEKLITKEQKWYHQ